MDFEPGDIKEKGRLQPGKILMVDTEKGEIYYDGELKKQLAEAKPYKTWLANNRVELDELKSGRKVPHTVDNYDKLLRTFGYSREDIEKIIVPSVPWVTTHRWLSSPTVRSYYTTISASSSHK